MINNQGQEVEQMATQTPEAGTAATPTVQVQMRAGEVVIDGRYPVPVPEGQTPQAAAIGWIVENRAKPADRPVTVYAHEGGAVTHFVVHPNGQWSDVYQVQASQQPPAQQQQQQQQPRSGQQRPVTQPRQPAPAQQQQHTPPAPQNAAQRPEQAPWPTAQTPQPAQQHQQSAVQLGNSPAPPAGDHSQHAPAVSMPTPPPFDTYEPVQPPPYGREFDPDDYGAPVPGQVAGYADEPGPGRLNLSELAPRQAPQTRSRWRRMFRMGPSPVEVAHQRRIDRLQQPLHGQTYICASMQIKGGDGKTTSAVLAAQAIAENTGHHVVVVSADPANGNLLERTVDFPTDDELMRHPTAIDLYEAEMEARRQGRIGLTDAYEIGRFLALAGRLRVVGARQIVQDDEDEDTGLTADQVTVITECLSRVFDVIIFDCGTGPTTAAAKTIMKLAHSLILVTNPTWDTLRKGEQSLDLIQYRRPEILARSTIGLVHCVPAGAEPTTFRLNEALARLSARVGSVTEIPYDPWIHNGTAILWDRLQQATRDAALDLAGTCADAWAHMEPAHPREDAESRADT